MKHLKRLLNLQLQKIPNSFAIALLVIALLGFADATYLTIEHFQGVIPPCTTGGCELVLTSAYSQIWGIPVALLGSIYYLLISIGMVAYLDSKNTNILKWTLSLTVFGLLCSIWFVVLQLFIIKSICQYCMFSATTSATLFILANIVFRKYIVKEQGILPN